MKKRWTKLLPLLCTSLLLCGCGQGGVNTKPQAKPVTKEPPYQANLDLLVPKAYGEEANLHLEPGTTFALIGKRSDGAYWKKVKQGAMQAVDDLNKALKYDGKDKIKVVYSGCTDGEDVEEQVNILDEEMARYPAALGIAIIDEKACKVQFDLAAENDLPIVVFDSGSDYKGINSTISTNNIEAGKMAMERLGEALHEEGEIGLFIGEAKSMSSIDRQAGIAQSIQERYPKVKVVDTFYGDQLVERSKKWSEEKNQEKEVAEPDTKEEVEAQSSTTNVQEQQKEDKKNQKDGQAKKEKPDMTQDEMIEAIIKAHPDMAGCIADNEEMIASVQKAVQNLGRKDFKILGFDGNSKQIKAVENGKIVGLLMQNPFGMGYATIIAQARSVLGLPNEARVNSGFFYVNKRNIDTKEIRMLLEN